MLEIGREDDFLLMNLEGHLSEMQDWPESAWVGWRLLVFCSSAPLFLLPVIFSNCEIVSRDHGDAEGRSVRIKRILNAAIGRRKVL